MPSQFKSQEARFSKGSLVWVRKNKPDNSWYGIGRVLEWDGTYYQVKMLTGVNKGERGGFREQVESFVTIDWQIIFP